MSTPSILSLVPPSRPAKAPRRRVVKARAGLALVPPADPLLALDADCRSMQILVFALYRALNEGVLSGLGFVVVNKSGGYTVRMAGDGCNSVAFKSGVAELVSQSKDRDNGRGYW